MILVDVVNQAIVVECDRCDSTVTIHPRGLRIREVIAALDSFDRQHQGDHQEELGVGA